PTTTYLFIVLHTTTTTQFSSLSLHDALPIFTRSSMLDVLHQPFMRTAKAKGIPHERRVLRHAIPNAAIPVVTVVGMRIGGLIGGDRKSTRLNSSHVKMSYAVFGLKKNKVN